MVMHQSSSILALTARLRAFIGSASPGDALPSSRELIQKLHVSPVTVSRALANLSSEGLISVRPGVGAFVAPQGSQAARRDADYSWQTSALGDHAVDDRGMRLLAQGTESSSISLASGYPHASLAPTRQLVASMRRAVSRPGVWEIPQLSGIPSLRRWFAETVGPMVGPDDVLITSGGQSAIAAALRATSPIGSPVIVESPTYPGLIAVIKGAGLEPIPVPLDEYGLRPDFLGEALARSKARVIYCQPTFQNPTGAVMPLERRLEILKVAARARAFVIEDDWARWLTLGPAPTAPLISHDEDGRVIHIKSLTKTTASSLRIGALVARGPIAERLRAVRVVDDLFVSAPLQEAALDLVTSPGWARHLKALPAALRQRRDGLLTALERSLPTLTISSRPAGGFYVWAQLPPGSDDVAVAAAAQREGVLVSAGRPFFVAEPSAPFLRISFVSPASLQEIDEGVRRLARAIPHLTTTHA